MAPAGKLDFFLASFFLSPPDRTVVRARKKKNEVGGQGAKPESK